MPTDYEDLLLQNCRSVSVIPRFIMLTPFLDGKSDTSFLEARTAHGITFFSVLMTIGMIGFECSGWPLGNSDADNQLQKSV